MREEKWMAWLLNLLEPALAQSTLDGLGKCHMQCALRAGRLTDLVHACQRLCAKCSVVSCQLIKNIAHLGPRNPLRSLEVGRHYICNDLWPCWKRKAVNPQTIEQHSKSCQCC